MGIEIKEELLDIEGIKNSNKSLLDLFIRRTAVVTSTREDLVEKIIKDQWRQANKKAQAGNSIGEFDFCNLGTFFISKNKANKRIQKINDIQQALNNQLIIESEIKKNRRRETLQQKNIDMIKSIKLKIKQDES